MRARFVLFVRWNRNTALLALIGIVAMGCYLAGAAAVAAAVPASPTHLKFPPAALAQGAAPAEVAPVEAAAVDPAPVPAEAAVRVVAELAAPLRVLQAAESLASPPDR